MNLSIFYRGPLSSCNYGCGYCPFAKRIDSKRQLSRDRQSLQRFTSWLAAQPQHQWNVMFTPWGEALVRAWYREAIAVLSGLPQVATVAVQTNLSCRIDWIAKCRLDRLALWATFHPTETDARPFLRKVRQLRDWGVRLSVGMVGVPELLENIIVMRQELPADVYLWINAQQPRSRPYTVEEVARFSSVDPHFTLTARRRPSLGKPCRTGETAFTVDGSGNMRRCHFVAAIIGNIYESGWEQSLLPRPCPNRFCDCFLGKAQLRDGALEAVFAAQVIERIPLAASDAAGH